MYIYITVGKQYEVGYYITKYGHNGPYNQWNSETTWDNPDQAACRVNYLNGGTGHNPKHTPNFFLSAS